MLDRLFLVVKGLTIDKEVLRNFLLGVHIGGTLDVTLEGQYQSGKLRFVGYKLDKLSFQGYASE